MNGVKGGKRKDLERVWGKDVDVEEGREKKQVEKWIWEGCEDTWSEAWQGRAAE